MRASRPPRRRDARRAGRRRGRSRRAQASPLTRHGRLRSPRLLDFRQNAPHPRGEAGRLLHRRQAFDHASPRLASERGIAPVGELELLRDVLERSPLIAAAVDCERPPRAGRAPARAGCAGTGAGGGGSGREVARRGQATYASASPAIATSAAPPSRITSSSERFERRDGGKRGGRPHATATRAGVGIPSSSVEASTRGSAHRGISIELCSIRLVARSAERDPAGRKSYAPTVPTASRCP